MGNRIEYDPDQIEEADDPTDIDDGSDVIWPCGRPGEYVIYKPAD